MQEQLTENRWSRVRDWFPEGHGLTAEVWTRRHGLLCWIVALHIPALYGFGLFMGLDPLHLVWETGILLVLLVVGRIAVLPEQFRALSVSLGLISASALSVHFSGGFIEAHFHFFVVLPLIALYQRWLPFLASVLFIVLHHGITGVLDPTSVYNHPDAIAHPWRWATIHATFILAECLALFRLWREVEVGLEAAAEEKHKAEQLLEIQYVKDRLLRTVSHELNTPLTPIKLQLRLLHADEFRKDPANLDASVDLLDRNFNRLERLVKSVLDVVRIDGNHLQLNQQQQDLSVLAKAAIATYEPFANENQVTLLTELEQASAAVDEERISQLFDNFLSNAIKYSPPGGTVTVKLQKIGANVRISVQDQGRGLLPDEIDRLFEPFGMVHGEEDMVATTGLGLYICKGIVESHGGTIGITSEGAGFGSKFWAEIPIEKRVDAEPKQ